MDNTWLSQDCFYVDKRQQASKVLGYLRGDRKDIPIIEDNGRPYAIVDPRAAMRRGLHHQRSIDKLAWPVPTVKDGDTDAAVLAAFATSGAPQLPAYMGRPPRKAGFMDAGRFLQKRFEHGPTSAEAAQGLPPLWKDSTIEDAIQAFAASALPYLPVTDETVEGIVRREAVLPYLEHDPGHIGKHDRIGDRAKIRDESIDALIEGHAPMLRTTATFAEVKDALQEQPCWFVDQNGIEAITAVSVLQNISSKAQVMGAAAPYRYG